MSNPECVTQINHGRVEWVDKWRLGRSRKQKISRGFGSQALGCFREQSLAAGRPMKSKECLLSKGEDDELKSSLI